jgi:MoaA/NifB/PqqE/SkfB family radical SAM enzyme
MASNTGYVDLFNHNIHTFFRQALQISLRDPAMAPFLYRTLRAQQKATSVRQTQAAKGVHVPPFMIASITRGCNLHCKGCYARAQRPHSEPEMSPDKLRSVIAEARDLGVSIILIAGGEPLTRPEILDIIAEFPEIVFPLFTNGLLIDDEMVARFRKQRNLVPVISLEGHEGQTDDRRGRGVYGHLLQTLRALGDANVFFGVSLTATRLNLPTITDERFVRDLVDTGSRLFFYVDYVPVQPGTEALALTEAQRAQEAEALVALRRNVPALFVAFPGDEEMYGGCLAAGRGFVHISPEGRLEPCPFSPYSDVSLHHVSLREALQSRLLRTIRESDEHLSEVNGGCALWEKRDWVHSLLQPAEVEA